MKKLLFFVALAACTFGATAQIRISEMSTFIGNPSGGYVPIVIAGVNRKIDAVYFGANKLDNVFRKPGTDSLFLTVNSVNSFVSRVDTLPTSLAGVYSKTQTDSIINLHRTIDQITTAGSTTSNSISVYSNFGSYHAATLGYDNYSGQFQVVSARNAHVASIGARYVDSNYIIDLPKIHIAPSARATIPYSVNGQTADTTGAITIPTDTAAISSFSVKVRSLHAATTPITYNNATGTFGMDNQGTTAQVLHGNASGAAAFSSVVSTDISGRIDTAHLFIQTLNIKYPLLVSATQDSLSISKTFTDSLSGFNTDSLNYAGRVYGILGGVVKAEPMNGNISNVTSNVAISSGVTQFLVVYLPRRSTITGVKWWQGTSGVYTADAYNGMQLYSLATGTLTTIDSTVNDGNTWKGSGGSLQTKNFSTTHSLAAGVYVIAFLYHTSAQTTQPTIGAFGGTANGATDGLDFANGVRLTGSLSAQTAMPSPTQAMSGLTASSSQYYLSLY